MQNPDQSLKVSSCCTGLLRIIPIHSRLSAWQGEQSHLQIQADPKRCRFKFCGNVSLFQVRVVSACFYFILVSRFSSFCGPVCSECQFKHQLYAWPLDLFLVAYPKPQLYWTIEVCIVALVFNHVWPRTVSMSRKSLMNGETSSASHIATCSRPNYIFEKIPAFTRPWLPLEIQRQTWITRTITVPKSNHHCCWNYRNTM